MTPRCASLPRTPLVLDLLEKWCLAGLRDRWGTIFFKKPLIFAIFGRKWQRQNFLGNLFGWNRFRKVQKRIPKRKSRFRKNFPLMT